MLTPFITSDPATFRSAMERIARRGRTPQRPSLFRRLFPARVPHCRREHVAHISPTEVVHSNLPFLYR